MVAFCFFSLGVKKKKKKTKKMRREKKGEGKTKK